MATLMEKDAMMEMVNGAIATLTKLKVNDGPTRQSLYNLNAALLENSPEIFDFEGTIKLVKKMVSKYDSWYHYWQINQGRLSNVDVNTLCLQRFRLLNKRVALSFSISSELRPVKDKVLFRNKLNTPSYCSFRKSEKIILLTLSSFSSLILFIVFPFLENHFKIHVHGICKQGEHLDCWILLVALVLTNFALCYTRTSGELLLGYFFCLPCLLKASVTLAVIVHTNYLTS